MLHCLLGPAASGPPPSPLLAESSWALPGALLALACAALLSLLRASLQNARSARVISRAKSEAHAERMRRLLERVDPLASSAGMLLVTCELLFMVLLLGAVQGDSTSTWSTILRLAAVAVPSLLVFTESLPQALARKYGDSVLLHTLPAFQVLQLPLQAVAVALEGLRKAIWRMTDVPVESAETREIVEGLREVIEDTARRGDFDATERELIENVMEFADVDVAEVMTPRTEIHGVDVDDGLAEAIRVAAEEGHSRIPVYEENLDNIVGYISARGIVQLLSERELEGANLKEHLRPVYFVPETKQVSALLAEFRKERRKMAIVLDEYGGTAGMVTLGDILGEIVGDIADEFDREDPEPVRLISPGVAELQAGVRIAEVNETLDLELPEEEDYETLGGFVLSELGHFPRRGEQFEWEGASFEVLEASDRRVLRVRVATAEVGTEG